MRCFLILSVASMVILIPNLPASDPVANDKKKCSISGLPGASVCEFKADAYISAAIALQIEGKEKTAAILKEAIEKQQHGVIVLCRMLFRAAGAGQFRRPSLGGPFFLGTTDFKQWPLEPIEIVDGVPFFLVNCYFLAGWPESEESYLEYCLGSCDWSTEKYKIRTAQEKQKALEKLIGSPHWTKALTESAKKSLASQIE
jgi:hypothetical protein